MALNPDIISEINCAEGIDEKTKAFLIWAVNFEKENLDLDKPRFKAEFLSQLERILRDNEDIDKKDINQNPNDKL